LIGNFVLLLLGGIIVWLGMIAGDGRSFFLLFGLHLLASGVLGATCTSFNGWRALCLTSLVVNALLLVRILLLILDGTVRGPLVVAAPLLFGLSAALNVVAALSSLSRANATQTDQPFG
jgi:hypothetical protein